MVPGTLLLSFDSPLLSVVFWQSGKLESPSRWRISRQEIGPKLEVLLGCTVSGGDDREDKDVQEEEEDDDVEEDEDGGGGLGIEEEGEGEDKLGLVTLLFGCDCLFVLLLNNSSSMSIKLSRQKW